MKISHSPMLPIGVGFITGMVDVIGWLTLGHFYTANITGDLTQSTSYLLPSEPPHLLQILAIPVFVVGLVASYATARRLGVHTRAIVRLMLVVQAALLLGAAFTAGALGAPPLPGGVQHTLIGLLAILTICLSNTTMNIIDHGAATTWALTANTVRAGVAILNVVTRHGTPDQRANDLRTFHAIWPTIMAFLAGGLVAVAGLHHLGVRAWLLPGASAILFAVFLWRDLPRTDACPDDTCPPLRV